MNHDKQFNEFLQITRKRRTDRFKSCIILTHDLNRYEKEIDCKNRVQLIYIDLISERWHPRRANEQRKSNRLLSKDGSEISIEETSYIVSILMKKKVTSWIIIYIYICSTSSGEENSYYRHSIPPQVSSLNRISLNFFTLERYIIFEINIIEEQRIVKSYSDIQTPYTMIFRNDIVSWIWKSVDRSNHLILLMRPYLKNITIVSLI